MKNDLYIYLSLRKQSIGVIVMSKENSTIKSSFSHRKRQI